MIPVKRIVFNQPPFDVPGKDAAGGLDSGSGDGRHWELFYVSSLGHHKIVYYSHLVKEPPRVVYVDRSRVATWEPA